MRPQIAAIITACLVGYLFRVDGKRRLEGVSPAVWVPFAWMFFAGTRYLSEWIHPGAFIGSTDVFLDGSPLDRAVFLILMALAVLILSRRNLDWKTVFRENSWIWLLLLFEALSFLWSDYPFVSFKRWNKALGTAIMALVICTEQRPAEALGAIIRRLSFVTLPLSVLFIKYYPDLGRAYFMGEPMLTGVAAGKNGLGMLCLICGIYYAWKLVLDREGGELSPHRIPRSVYFLILPLIVWLLFKSKSATSLTCIILAVALILVSRQPSARRTPLKIVALGLVSLGALAILEVTLGVSGLVIRSLGRDPTLTTRVPMWHDLLGMAGNPLVGVGYESFWLGARRDAIWARYGALIQAHNGYLETYLNLGIVGLALVAAVILSGISKAVRQLRTEYNFAVLRMILISIVIVYNWTEASLYGVNNMWLLLLVSVLGPSGRYEAVRIKDGRFELEGELAEGKR